jgi:pimeloyl-ACP methyl ester carboxylesterase
MKKASTMNWKAFFIALFISFNTINAQSQMEKKTFILIHGSWHSAWNWHKVVPILESHGHRAIAIDLPGMGRDKTPIQSVTMEMVINKICEIIDRVEGKVILVGHSKNGIMISQAAEYRPDKIEKLVYLAAYLIPNGKTQREYSILDTKGVLKPYITMYEETNSTTLSSEIYKDGLYHDCEENIIELAKVLLSHEPLNTGVTPLRLTENNFGRVPRFYIECTEDKAVTPFIQQKMYNDTPCRKIYKLATSHSPFFSKPAELVDILLDISAQ